MPKGNKAVKKTSILSDMETEESVNYPVDTEDSNTPGGYAIRESIGPKFYGIDASSNPVANEAGWIAEYWWWDEFRDSFGSSLAPTDYTARWDFISDDYAIEIKTSVPDYDTYGKATFMCPLSKFEKRPLYKSSYFIYWLVIDSFQKLIDDRDIPQTNWKYIELDASLVNPKPGSDELFGGMTKKKSSNGNPTYWYNGVYYFTIYKKEGHLQLIFREEILEG